MIEEEREEDERKLSVAIAAADRVNVLVSEVKKVHCQRAVLVNSSLQDPHFIFNPTEQCALVLPGGL